MNPAQPRRPIASLSIDLDNEWAYLRTRGDPAWETYPTYLPEAVPRMLEVLRRHALRVTVFVVGQDAALPENGDALRAIAAAGHEIGNHSMRHEPWLHRYPEAELAAELEAAEAHIERATGHRPVGFRGPGFSLTPGVVRLLARRGYAYDASTLPSFIGPLARAYFILAGGLRGRSRDRVDRLFGSWRDGFQSLRPYRWRVDRDSLVEIPVTTFPGLRVPIHLTYVHYLAGISRAAALAYFGAALRACRFAGVQPSILLHPLDFLGRGDAPRLDFFPTMAQPRERKLALVERCLERLLRHFEVVTVGRHAALAADTPLPWRAVAAQDGAPA